MSKCVLGEQNDDKIVKWTRKDGKMKLEVFSRIHLKELVGKHGLELPGIRNYTDNRSLNGCCTVSAYHNYPLSSTEIADK